MKLYTCCGILLVFLSGRALTHHYLLDTFPIQVDGRSFGLFKLLNLSKNSVLTRLSTLETSVAPIINGFTALPTQIASILTRLTAAEATIASLKAQLATSAVASCPKTAPSTALIVSGKCYDVVGTAVTFADAKAACTAGFGKLAEPAATGATALYTALQTAFPAATTSIGTAGAWIGLVQAPGGGATSPFFFTSTPGTPVANSFLTNPTALPAAGDTVKSVGFLATPNPLVAATPFTAIDSTPAANVPTKGFICQYS